VSAQAPYATLSPDRVLDAIAAAGLRPDGRLLALNSYENRVYQVGLEDGAFVVAKFYRSARWSDDAIVEEHAFARELADAELPVIAPLAFDGLTLLEHRGFRHAIYPRRGGRSPELESREHLEWVGRLIARMHGVGALAPFRHRGAIDPETFIAAPSRAVLASPLLPQRLHEDYRRAGVSMPRWRHVSMQWVQSRISACMAIAIPEICCGRTPARTSSIWTTHERGRRCRICGCWPTTTTRWTRCWKATRNSAISIRANAP
jgi:Ser/Thr protein kinase RdoA (MazF antagonist)